VTYALPSRSDGEHQAGTEAQRAQPDGRLDSDWYREVIARAERPDTDVRATTIAAIAKARPRVRPIRGDWT
jgi:hypothetical protein